MTISIGDAASELGVSVKTVRRWADAGKIRYERSPSGHRRFFISDIKRLSLHNPNGLDSRVTINYARVSSHDQKNDLQRQIQVLEAFSASKGWKFETVSDLGSGLNYNNKGLKKLLKRIMQGDVGRLVLTHKDRLLRFGSELVFAMCEEFETEVVIINKSHEEISFEQELVTDMIELITVFSARLYGSRSCKNKNLIDNMSKAVQNSQ
ncbi:IS607 family transposase [Okeania sp. SIO3B5]|uniref:IS607 family transposase n=1 Tax=Okeania sp. SIO3B5 TaxID=2607811 RepID=UPI0025DB17CD|nr:IS607 family transposase [Okeania sp. SIO3B5]